MAKSQSKKLPKLKSLEKLEVLLEILNEQSDRYVSYDEIEKEFIERVNSRKKFDEGDFKNKLINTLLYSEGLPELPPANTKGIPKQNIPHTASYLADIAQIRYTKLIDRMRLQLKVEGKTKEQDCYMITVRGIEVLNHLRNSRHSKELSESSRRLEKLTFVLIIFTFILIVTKSLPVSLVVLFIAILIAEFYFIFTKIKKIINGVSKIRRSN